MQLCKLGMNGPLASPQGLGCMGMSIVYGKPDDKESIVTIHRVLDLGINLIVTSNAYSNGKEEKASLSAAFPLDVTSGTRYPEAQMKGLGI